MSEVKRHDKKTVFTTLDGLRRDKALMNMTSMENGPEWHISQSPYNISPKHNNSAPTEILI